MVKKEITFPFNLISRRAVEMSTMSKEKIEKSFWLEKDNRRVNAKSLLGLLSLCARENDQVFLICENEKDMEEGKKIIKYLKEEF